MSSWFTEKLEEIMATDETTEGPTVKELKALAHDLHEAVRKSIFAPEGFGKLKRKILKELQHLQTLDDNEVYQSSNIYYLNAIWQTILDEGRNVCGVFKKFKYISEAINDQSDPLYNNPNINEDEISYAEYNSVPRRHRTADGRFKKSEIIVELVCDDGLRWIKVKTSNPYSMQMQFINSGSSSTKGKNIVTMADNFITAANNNKIYFQSPKIQFLFIEGITSDLAYILKQKSVIIKGKEIKEDFLYADDYEDDSEEDDDDEDDTEIETKENNDNEDSESCEQALDPDSVNLGVRTMLTMISALANNDLNESFFNELQNALYEKQQYIINNMFDENGERKTGPDNQKKSIPSNICTIPNLDFEYCDFPTYDDKGQKMKDDGNENGNEEKTDNRFTASGYTIGNVGKLKISQTQRKKKFSEKSYEEQKMLLQMYIDELQSPVLPQINQCIENKKLMCCESAWNHFMDIVNLSAGPNEWKRCKELQSKITIVKDQVSERTHELNGKSMSQINKAVFGTGDSLRVLTLTAIASFVRKAEQQGVKYFAHVHPVRPLTERYQREYDRKKRENEMNNINNGQFVATQLDDIAEENKEDQDEMGMIIVEEDELHESEVAEINDQLDYLGLDKVNTTDNGAGSDEQSQHEEDQIMIVEEDELRQDELNEHLQIID